MTITRKVWFIAIAAAVAFFVMGGGAGFALNSATQHKSNTQTQGSGQTGSGQTGSELLGVPTVSNSAQTQQGKLASGDALSSFYGPYGNGPFAPGPPPSGQVSSGDGIGAWGVAFKEVADQNTQADADLIKSAYQDAQKRAQTLASATGLKLGNLLAINDYTVTEPNYKACVQPMMGAPGKFQQGSGSATVEPGVPTRPVPTPSCQAKFYAVAWVIVRYAISS